MFNWLKYLLYFNILKGSFRWSNKHDEQESRNYNSWKIFLTNLVLLLKNGRFKCYIQGEIVTNNNVIKSIKLLRYIKNILFSWRNKRLLRSRRWNMCCSTHQQNNKWIDIYVVLYFSTFFLLNNFSPQFMSLSSWLIAMSMIRERRQYRSQYRLRNI